MVNNLLQEDGIILRALARNEAALKRANEVPQKRPKTMPRDFGDKLVQDITQSDRMKILEISGIIMIQDNH